MAYNILRHPILRLSTCVFLGLILFVYTDLMADTVLSTSSGLRARIHTVDDLLPWLNEDATGRFLVYPGAGRLELLTGIDDPRLIRNDIQDFFPLAEDPVAEALRAVHGLELDLVVDVFLLPAPPVETMGSFARTNAIFLSPGVGEVAPESIAQQVVHELGHVLTWAYFDSQPDAWRQYMSLRSLDPLRNGSEAVHRDRSREILAEDIRYLFGGETAVSGSGIENPDLPLPDQLSGLETFLAESLKGRQPSPLLADCRAFPNPFNPRTTIELVLAETISPPEATDVRLSILDVMGRIVMRIEGGRVENGRAIVEWNGRRQGGTAAASGRYFYIIEAGSSTGRGSITLVR